MSKNIDKDHLQEVIGIIENRIEDLKKHKQIALTTTEKFLADARIIDMQYILSEVIKLKKENSDDRDILKF